MSYYLVSERELQRRELHSVLDALTKCRQSGREAVALYWPEDGIYTIAAEPDKPDVLPTVNGREP